MFYRACPIHYHRCRQFPTSENRIRYKPEVETVPQTGSLHLTLSNIITLLRFPTAGRATGPEISASRWLNCIRAILHCWRPISTASDVETLPLVHIAMVLMRRQNIWSYTAQHMARRGGSHGQITTIKATQDAYGASWRGSGRWPGMRERERETVHFHSHSCE